jgi:hypothetical protein
MNKDIVSTQEYIALRSSSKDQKKDFEKEYYKIKQLYDNMKK